MRLFVALFLTGIAVVLQDFLVSGHVCTFSNSETCDPAMNSHAQNGLCNNEATTAAGSSESPFGRYISYLATGGTGNIPFKTLFRQLFPSPREISRKVFPCLDGMETSLTHLFAVFGKLLMFDTICIHRNLTTDECCDSCLGIPTDSSNDPRRACPCMDYHRPILSYNLSCTGGLINGINECTHVIDASFIFDNDVLQASKTSAGKFNTVSNFLPTVGEHFDGVYDHLNESPLLMALFHVFVREYNSLVYTLTTYGLTDPAVEARRLLIALFQHITYKEFLPLLLGINTTVLSNGTLTYNSTNMPIISHSFSLAYKLAVVSMLRENVTIAPGTVVNIVDIVNGLTYIDSNTEMKNIVEGMLNEASLKIDNKIPCALRNTCNYSDIVAVVTQDTRLFGIPPYIVWLALTGQMSVNNIASLPYQDTANKDALKDAYYSIYDIDFLSGLFTESSVEPAQVGPTLQKLLNDQFETLQKGDRFYYENAGIFEPYQLEQIRNVCMAHLLCRNVLGVTVVKQNAFDNNSLNVECAELNYIDFCKYVNISREWSAYQPSSPICYLFQISFRTCQSSKPDLCECEGDPIKFESCPGDMWLNSDLLVYLMNKANNDPEVREYLKYNMISEMNTRIYSWYKDMNK